MAKPKAISLKMPGIWGITRQILLFYIYYPSKSAYHDGKIDINYAELGTIRHKNTYLFLAI